MIPPLAWWDFQTTPRSPEEPNSNSVAVQDLRDEFGVPRRLGPSPTAEGARFESKICTGAARVLVTRPLLLTQEPRSSNYSVCGGGGVRSASHQTGGKRTYASLTSLGESLMHVFAVQGWWASNRQRY